MTLPEWLPEVAGLSLVRGLVIFAMGLVLAWFAGVLALRTARRVAPEERAVLVKRVVFYGLIGLTVVSVLRELGFDLSVVLGAAGVFTVAIGFASQTSASNVISGLFLIGEQPFSTGDWIKIGGTTGEVVGIDLLSVKLRTAANLFVRVPNETVMKAEITNFTRYPIRRLDVAVGIGYGEDLDRVKSVVIALCDRDPLVLDEPRPVIRFESFADSGVNLNVAAWTAREHFVDVRDAFAFKLKAELDRQGIEIPFPHRTLYTGKHQQPIEVRVVDPS